MALHPLLAAVFEVFDAAGLRWCLLRGETALADPSGDIDLLVAPRDLQAARRALTRLGFVPLPSWGRGSHRAFISYHAATDRWLELDVVTRLDYGPEFALRLDVARQCLCRRCRIGPIAALDPDDAFWALLLHRLLDKGTIDALSRGRLRDLVGDATAGSPLAAAIGRHGGPEWGAERLLRAARAGDWPALESAGSQLVAALRRRRPVAARHRAATSRVLRTLETPQRALFRRGLSVALLGPDGAGKSTLAASLARSFYFPVRPVYMGLWQRRPPGTRAWALSRLPGLAAARRPLRAWWGYLGAQCHRARGGLVIFDRYTYDALLPPRHRVPWFKRPYYWLLAHACPAPDLVLVLDAPGEVMFARKGEFDPAHLERERREYLALRGRIRSLQIVDGARAPEEVRADVTSRIWQCQLSRWNGR